MFGPQWLKKKGNDFLQTRVQKRIQASKSNYLPG
jgi:hypothetical protein